MAELCSHPLEGPGLGAEHAEAYGGLNEPAVLIFAVVGVLCVLRMIYIFFSEF